MLGSYTCVKFENLMILCELFFRFANEMKIEQVK
jgi:hypothetical protein